MTISATAYTDIASLSLPAGSYVVTATQRIHNNSGSDNAPVNCLLDLGATASDTYSMVLQPFTSTGISTTTMSVTKAGTFASTTSVLWHCQDNAASGSDSITVSNVHLIAIKVGALHNQ